jgi:hypothetical protein
MPTTKLQNLSSGKNFQSFSCSGLVIQFFMLFSRFGHPGLVGSFPARGKISAACGAGAGHNAFDATPSFNAGCFDRDPRTVARLR